MEQNLPTQPGECVSCGTALQGKFCYSCGEKKLSPSKDFSVWHFLVDTFEHFTHLDSKLLRSLWALFSKPGFLTAEFIAGRRVRYFKPIPLFVIASILFYLFFEKATSFFINLGDISQGYTNGNWLTNTFHVDTGSLFTQKATAANREPAAYWQEMSLNAAEKSKTWLFLIVPVWGLAIWAFFYRKIKWFVPHLIFALHGLTFFVLFDMVALLFGKYVLGFNQLGDLFVLVLAICFALYNVLAVRRVYELGWLAAAFAGTATMLSFLIVLMLYRQVITIWTLMVY